MAWGLSLRDFCALTPSECAAVLRCKGEAEEARRRDAWERTRTAAVMALLPHLRKGASRRPQDLLPLPWDKAREGRAKGGAGAGRVSREEAYEQFKALTGRSD